MRRASVDRRGTVIADDDVERLGSHEVQREIRRVVGQPGRQRRGDAQMRQVGSDQTIECGDEPVGAFGRKVEPEQLDRDQATWVGLIGAKDGAENAGADLMENANGPKASGGAVPEASVCSVVLLEGRCSDRNTETRLFNRLAVLQ